MKISDELKQLSAAINYLSQKRKDILSELKANPEKHGCPYRIGQEIKEKDGKVYKVEKIEVLTYYSTEGLCAYYQAYAVSQDKPFNPKKYIKPIE